MDTQLDLIKRHQTRLKRCRRCPDIQQPVVVGNPVVSEVLLVGQAPGNKEIEMRKPFAWTAGKTLFKWFDQIGLTEEAFRQCIYMAAVCRCFPGKNPKGGDRVPSPQEIANCHGWLEAELQLLKPKLIVPVGKLAITQFIPVTKLDKVVGKRHALILQGFKTDVIPLPHPSGASVWHRVEPGKTLLKKALQNIRRHRAWQQLLAQD
jgi:uracil-DNA glycosylase